MADLNTPNPEITVRRARIGIHEQQLVIEHKELRLLELEEERQRVNADIAASQSHLKKLQSEVSQQEALIAASKERKNG